MMYSDRARQLFADVKAVFDPRDLLNPGVLVRPDPIDANLRRPQAKSLLATDGFSFSRDAGDFTTAVHRCVGMGSCRADTGAAGGFMCPSYLASGDEKDVTRGRARVLQELTNGALIADWASAEVHESLDLCLSCKACASDCPAGVDMAQYKSEVLHRSYRHRIRPVGHYSMGWLPRWISVIGALPGFVPSVVNRLLSCRPLSRVLLPLAGIDSRRRAPTFAAVGFRRQRRRMLTGSAAGDDRPPVLLWADSFTDGLSPEVARAAERVLGSAGYRVIVPEDEACCGLTWITTGQLTAARKRLLRLINVLEPYAAKGIPIVALEPSCCAVLRSDLVELIPDDPRAVRVARAVTTMAELLARTNGWRPPDLSGTRIIVQPHCHQHAVMGFAADRALLEQSAAEVTFLAGCCGLAGNFGMEKGHYEMSLAVAENALLPALRGRRAGTVVLADGFSCRVQMDQLAGVRGISLSELLAANLPINSSVVN